MKSKHTNRQVASRMVEDVEKQVREIQRSLDELKRNLNERFAKIQNQIELLNITKLDRSS